MQAMSLQTEEMEGEQNEIALLRSQLMETNDLVKVLSAQLGDLRQRVGRRLCDIAVSHCVHFTLQYVVCVYAILFL